MIRYFVLRIILPLILFLVLRAVLRTIFTASDSRTPERAQRPSPPAAAGGELKKDPVCGTYVAADTGLTAQVGGQTVYFCSPECRDKYRAA